MRLRSVREGMAAARTHFRNGTNRTAAKPSSPIAHDQPHTTDALLAVAGVGPVKVNRYGDGILAVVADHSMAD